MKVKVIKTYSLTDLISEENIVSVLPRKYSSYGKSFAIAFKGGTSIDIPSFKIDGKYYYIYIHGYGGIDINSGRIAFISADKYTYNIPDYVALPKELYKYVKIIVKYDEEQDIVFAKCSITKKVTW